MVKALDASGGWGFSPTGAVAISCQVTLLTCVETEPSIKVVDASGGWGLSPTDAVAILWEVTLLTCVETQPSIRRMEAFGKLCNDMMRMRNSYIGKRWECNRETLRRHSEADHDASLMAAVDISLMVNINASAALPHMHGLFNYLLGYPFSGICCGQTSTSDIARLRNVGRRLWVQSCHVAGLVEVRTLQVTPGEGYAFVALREPRGAHGTPGHTRRTILYRSSA